MPTLVGQPQTFGIYSQNKPIFNICRAEVGGICASTLDSSPSAIWLLGTRATPLLIPPTDSPFFPFLTLV